MALEQKNNGNLRELALFSGAGGGILGGKLLGWQTVCAVEIDSFCRRVLMQRQNDGMLDPFPIWDDICTFNGKPWRGIVDVVSGGFPCQDISSAGKGIGITGKRSGLWKEMARIIGEVRPRFVFVENSPLLRSRGLFTVLKDLTKMGYDAKWGVVGAHHVGAPHKRDRIWIVANANSKPRGIQQVAWEKCENSSNACNDGTKEYLADSDSAQCERNECAERIESKHTNISGTSWWSTEPDVGRVAHGVANRMDRLKAIGNGQVPFVAATAWKILRSK